MKRLFLWGMALLAALSACRSAGDFTPAERALAASPDSTLYVLDVAVAEDSVFLRGVCTDFPPRALRSDTFRRLAAKMLATVRAPWQDGVGLAAPQVGLSHRVVVLQRLDKEGEPFEVYPNLHILRRYGKVKTGPEGCLSVPPYRGWVPRSDSVSVSYLDPETLRPVREEIGGFTAVIFQHETDHLDGILYTDRADTVFVNEGWAAERAVFAAEGRYRR